MSDEQIVDDLSDEPDHSVLLHFDRPKHMTALEKLFAETMKTFGLSKEELKAKADFNFDVYDMTGFESIRAEFRIANALGEKGFAEFAFLKKKGLADLTAMKDGQRWFIEVKTLVLQTRSKSFSIEETTEIFKIDKFQPESCSTHDYIERVAKQIAGDPIQKARQQLLETVTREGQANKMIGFVVNLFATDFFLDADHLSDLRARLVGNFTGWEKNYLADVDALAFLTSQELYLF